MDAQWKKRGNALQSGDSATPGQAPNQNVAQWYEGSCILLTGGSGFIGKVLLERILSALPVAKVFVLVRPKRQKSPQQRLQDIFALPLFDVLRRDRPEVLAKVEAVAGDLTAAGLGLAEADRERILQETTIVFHGAASVRLETTLSSALRDNTRSTRWMLDLAKGMPHLKAFVHISTAFCHPELETLEERTYDSPAPPEEVLALIDWMDDKTLDAMAPLIIGVHPNSYTFSKRLAEKLVDEERSRLPVLICRPSIVMPALKGPQPGWVDSLNGPVGVLVGAGQGVIRSSLCGREHAAEIVPVDLAANAIIVCAWDGFVNLDYRKETLAYNLSTGHVLRKSWAEFMELWYGHMLKNPFEGMVWYPRLTIRSNEILHFLIVFLFQFIPAYIFDFLLFLSGRKPFLVNLQRRIALGIKAVKYFTLREWLFLNQRGLAAENRLSPSERETFYLTQMSYDLDDYFRNLQLGARRFCQRQSPASLPRARMQLKILYVVDLLTKFICMAFLLYFILKYNPLKCMLNASNFISELV